MHWVRYPTLWGLSINIGPVAQKGLHNVEISTSGRRPQRLQGNDTETSCWPRVDIGSEIQERLHHIEIPASNGRCEHQLTAAYCRGTDIGPTSASPHRDTRAGPPRPMRSQYLHGPHGPRAHRNDRPQPPPATPCDSRPRDPTVILPHRDRPVGKPIAAQSGFVSAERH